MTLSNIFFGKKVVQQAYLNNALIYQSKGWETLPSTCSEVWTKELGIVNSDSDIVNQCLIDKNNNIYVLTHYQIFKLDSEGTLIWSKTIGGIQRIAIDINNNVYIALINSGCSYIAELDNNGVMEKQFEIDIRWNHIENFVVDNNYFYISGNYNYTSNNCFYQIDEQGKLITQDSLNLAPSTLVENDSFVYAGLGAQLIKINKSNISNYTPLSTIPSGASVDNVILDGIGNAIFTDTNGVVYKYDFKNNVVTEYSRRIVESNPTIALDYQKNLYFISSGSNVTGYILSLMKYSSDRTLIFDTQILTDQDKSMLHGKLVVDNNGNIYYLYNKYNSNLNYSLMIKKLINIEKKGN